MLGYALVAVAFSWPLLPNAATHLTGDPGGDTGVYVWNQWVFQHGAIVERRNPLTTEHIFSLSPRPVDLTQHNYTCSSTLLALPLIGWLGPVATFNVVYLLVGGAHRMDDVRAGTARHRRRGRSSRGWPGAPSPGRR